MKESESMRMSSAWVACLGCLLGGCDQRSDDRRATPEYESHLQTVEDQNARFRAQLDLADQQMKKVDEQGKRYDLILQEWETQQRRIDSLLDEWDELTAKLKARESTKPLTNTP